MSTSKNIYFVHDDGTAELRSGDAHILLDAADVELAAQYQWTVGTHGYATHGAGKNQILLHRLLMGLTGAETVDHINRNKLDNRRSNLRVCTMAQNSMNKDRLDYGQNPYKGICKTRQGTWQAQITHKGNQIYLGCYHDPVDAAKAYDTAARRLYGEYAFLNFPDCTDAVEAPITHYKKLGKESASSIRSLYGEGYSIPDLAVMFSHSPSAIRKIVKGRTYKEVV